MSHSRAHGHSSGRGRHLRHQAGLARRGRGRCSGRGRRVRGRVNRAAARWGGSRVNPGRTPELGPPGPAVSGHEPRSPPRAGDHRLRHVVAAPPPLPPPRWRSSRQGQAITPLWGSARASLAPSHPPLPRSHLAGRAAALRLPRGMVVAEKLGPAQRRRQWQRFGLEDKRRTAKHCRRKGAGPRGHASRRNRWACGRAHLYAGLRACPLRVGLVSAPFLAGSVTPRPPCAWPELCGPWGHGPVLQSAEGLRRGDGSSPFKNHRGAQGVGLVAVRAPGEK